MFSFVRRTDTDRVDSYAARLFGGGRRAVLLCCVILAGILARPLVAFERITGELLDDGTIAARTALDFLSFDWQDANSFQAVQEVRVGGASGFDLGFRGIYEFSNRFEDGVSELEVDVIKRLKPESFGFPEVGGRAFIRFGGEEGVFTTTAEVDFGGAFRFLKTFSGKNKVALELGSTFRGDKPGQKIETSFDYALGWEKQMSSSFILSAEVFGKTSAFDTGFSVVSLGSGFRYVLARNLSLRGFVGFGLNDKSPDLDAELGFQYRFQPGRSIGSADELDARAENYLQLGNRYAASGDWNRAGEAYRLAVEAEPLNVKALNNLGSALLQVGKYDEAEVTLQQAVELVPNDPDVFYNLGLARLHKNDLVGARRAWERVLELNPGHRAAARNLKILETGGVD